MGTWPLDRGILGDEAMRLMSFLLAVVLLVFSGMISLQPAHADFPTQIFAVDTCKADRSSVTLSWVGIDPAADEISLDLSYEDNGFQEGSFRNSGAVPMGSTSVIWDN